MIFSKISKFSLFLSFLLSCSQSVPPHWVLSDLNDNESLNNNDISNNGKSFVCSSSSCSRSVPPQRPVMALQQQLKCPTDTVSNSVQHSVQQTQSPFQHPAFFSYLNFQPVHPNDEEQLIPTVLWLKIETKESNEDVSVVMFNFKLYEWENVSFIIKLWK